MYIQQLQQGDFYVNAQSHLDCNLNDEAGLELSKGCKMGSFAATLSTQITTLTLSQASLTLSLLILLKVRTSLLNDLMSQDPVHQSMHVIV